MRVLSLEELLIRLDATPRPVLVEALNERAFHSGHLPGAVNLPRTQVMDRAAVLLPELDAEVIVYCRDEACQASGEVALMLMTLGYTNVAEFSGGKAAWVESGRPLEGQTSAAMRR